MRDVPACADLRRLGVELPDRLEDMEAAFGARALRRFVAAFGGRERNIPSRDVRGTALDRAVGPRVARGLRERMGGGRLRVPLGPASAAARRRVVVLRRLEAGRPLADAAEAAQCSLRAVSKHKARLRGRRSPSGERNAMTVVDEANVELAFKGFKTLCTTAFMQGRCSTPTSP